MKYRHCRDEPAEAATCLLPPVQAIDPTVHVSGAAAAARHREPRHIVVTAIQGGWSGLVR
jgi:hypothetical protein